MSHLVIIDEWMSEKMDEWMNEHFILLKDYQDYLQKSYGKYPAHK